jgi:heme-degrading monooxygenase HmoA
MLIRIWTVGLAPGKGKELEIFANTKSLPMLRARPGCVGVIFTRTDTQCVTITAWMSEEAIVATEESQNYADVVRQIECSGLLADNHSTEVLTVYGGFAADSFLQALKTS